MSRAGENSRVRALTCTACVSRARPTRTCDDTVVPVRRYGVGGNARESNTPLENFVDTVCRRPLGRTVGYYKGQWRSLSRFRDSMSRAGENSRVRALTCTACVSRARPTRTCDDTVVPVRRSGVGGNARESNTPLENFVVTVCRRPLGRTGGYYKGQWS